MACYAAVTRAARGPWYHIPMRHCSFLIVMIALLSGCRGGQDPVVGADAAFDAAAELSRQGKLTAAFDALRGALDDGYATPSRVLTDDRYRALLDDEALRPSVRELLEAHAREPRITMVHPDEPGTPMTVTIRIVDDADGAPVQGATVGLVQVDDRGYYHGTGEEVGWNPRLFGFARTGDDGVVVVRTIRPAHYGPSYGVEDEPAHIHHNLSRAGYRPRNGEFFFEDDPRVTDAMRTPEERVQRPIATVRVETDGTRTADVTITMQREGNRSVRRPDRDS